MSFLDGYLFMERMDAGPSFGFPATSATEIFNNGRTVANMTAARAAGLLNRQIYMTTEDCDCAGYFAYPDGTALPSENPWDDGSSLADEFLGPYVTDQTGMDGAHNRREVFPRAAFPYGANLSPLKPGQRIMEFTVLMVATSACGLDFGYEWLEELLLTSGCLTCNTSHAWMRACCPTGEDMTEGVWEFRDVGLAEGPIWKGPITDGTTGYIRELTLTLFAGDPCRWGNAEACLTLESITETPVCCTFGSQGRDYHVPIITLDIGTDADPDATTETNITIEIWDGGGLDEDCLPILDPDEYLFLTITVLPLPEGRTLYIDGAARRVVLYDPDTDTVSDGSIYIDSSAGFIDWDAYACRNDSDEVQIVLSTDDPRNLTITGSVATMLRRGC